MTNLAWYRELTGLLSRPGSLAFTHVGAVHCVSGETDSINLAAQGPSASSAFGLSDPDLRIWAASASHGDLAVINPGQPDEEHQVIEAALLELRDDFESARSRGASVWFASEYPLSRFPTLAASSLLADAETVRLRLLSEEQSVGLLLPIVQDPASARRIARFAGGSRALLKRFAEIDGSDCSGTKKLGMVQEVERDTAARAWAQLGPDLLSLVDSWVYESRVSSLPAEDVPNEAVLTSLMSSGVVRLDANDVLAVVPFVNRDTWVEALGDAVAQCTDAPDSWMRVAAELFSLERQLRATVAKRLQEQHGDDWRVTALVEYGGGLVELARRDGIAAATTIERLRSPLDWMQLSDLLDVARTLCDSGPVLGLRIDEWHRVQADVLHVRHRVAHMRLLRAGDLESVRKVRRLIDLRTQP